MIHYTEGNLLDSRAQALVNTVNTVGVMGKGIALMFKERFAENFRLYVRACQAGELRIGQVFVTEPAEPEGPRWIVNFPTKQHWRSPSRLEWIVQGLQSLRQFVVEQQVPSIAIPPLGAGHGGLAWPAVRGEIDRALGNLQTEITVFVPTRRYLNSAKLDGVQQLTTARALIVELVRRYGVMGFECSLLEVQKLAWFLDRSFNRHAPAANPLKLQFEPGRFGPYSHELTHLLDKLDGSYLRSRRRIGDARPFDALWFDERRTQELQACLLDAPPPCRDALEKTAALIDGFESPYGMELLATVDWLLARAAVAPTLTGVREGLACWPRADSAARKTRLFDDRALGIALDRLLPESAVREARGLLQTLAAWGPLSEGVPPVEDPPPQQREMF